MNDKHDLDAAKALEAMKKLSPLVYEAVELDAEIRELRAQVVRASYGR